MIKYVLGWILGVPVIVLVIIYILFNLAPRRMQAAR